MFIFWRQKRRTNRGKVRLIPYNFREEKHFCGDEWEKLLRYLRKIFAKGVREYTEKILSHIPELYPDIEVVRL